MKVTAFEDYLPDLLEAMKAAGRDREWWMTSCETVYTSCASAEEMSEVRAAIGGTWKKRVSPGEFGFFELEREFGPFTLQLSAWRNTVCEKVVTGTRTVQKPDPEAVVPLVDVVEEVFEWRCSPLLEKAEAPAT